MPAKYAIKEGECLKTGIPFTDHKFRKGKDWCKLADATQKDLARLHKAGNSLIEKVKKSEPKDESKAEA